MTAVLGPLAAGLAAEHLSARAAFALTEAACAAALAVTAVAARPARHPTRTVPGDDVARGGVLLRSGSQDHGGAS